MQNHKEAFPTWHSYGIHTREYVTRNVKYNFA
jgi:hypothetical protein